MFKKTLFVYSLPLALVYAHQEGLDMPSLCTTILSLLNKKKETNALPTDSPHPLVLSLAPLQTTLNPSLASTSPLSPLLL